jgi:transcriptional regulator with XRE-family HTH domain
MASIRKTFAQNLKAYRNARNLSQEQLAERLDINVRYVQQLEGKKTPNVKLDTIADLAKVLKVAPSDLIKEA